jgi:hypothetical protein
MKTDEPESHWGLAQKSSKYEVYINRRDKYLNSLRTVVFGDHLKMEIIKNIERLYETVNIYNAIFIYDHWDADTDLVYNQLLQAGYPVIKWEPDVEYMFISRLLFVSIYNIEALLFRDKSFFNMVLTCDDALFDKCMDIEGCEDMMLVRV